jgi:hypothetical protein
MTITIKPLTAVVLMDEIKDNVSITIKNDDNQIVLGPLIHHAMATKLDPTEPINGHLQQLIHQGMNIVALQSNMDGITLG